MKISLSNNEIFELGALEDISAIEESSQLEEEHLLTDFARQWYSGNTTFTFQTSGSTGSPKSIQLDRKTLIYSAEQTLQALDLLENNKPIKALLCISPKFIGGIMVFIRAWLANGLLQVIPSNTSFEKLERSYELASIVPLQVEKLLQHPGSLSKLSNVLIGGAPLTQNLEQKLADSLSTKQNWFATYGMTETASHVALRKVGEASFQSTGDARFSLDQRNCLQLSGTITNNQLLQTNDIVELLSESSFEWKGRYDFIINTGGVKVNPEGVEAILSKEFDTDGVIVTWVPDARLGQKVVCLSTKKFQLSSLNTEVLHTYHRPKAVILTDKLPLTSSGKLDRIASQELAEKLLT